MHTRSYRIGESTYGDELWHLWTTLAMDNKKGIMR